MKKFLTVLALLLVGIPSYADHLRGGTITYTHVSGKKYDVYVTIWRDCNGINASQSNLIVRSDTGIVGTITSQTRFNAKDISLADTSTSCGQVNGCKSSSGILGFEEHVWKMTVDFSNYGTNCSFSLEWTQSLRTAGITTGQSSTTFYVMSYINLCYDTLPREILKHSSPSLAAPHNVDFTYNPNFRDSYNYFDSISYLLSPTYTSPTQTGTYGGNFSPTRPMTFFGFPNSAFSWPAGFRLNSQLGNLEFRPTAVNQVAVVAYKVQGWKKYNDTMRLVGWVTEDYVLSVFSASTITNRNIKGTRQDSPIKVCANQTVCEEILVCGNDTSENIYSTLYLEDSTMSVDTVLARNDTLILRVCFTPDTSKIRIKPYIVSLNSYAYACFMIKRRVLDFGFVVTPPMDTLKKPLWRAERTCNQLQLSVYDTANTGFPIYIASDSTAFQNDTVNIALIDTGWLVFRMKQAQNGCDFILSDSFYVDSLYHFSTHITAPYKPCSNSVVLLSPSLSGGIGVASYLWSDSSTADTLSFTITNDSTFWLKVLDSSGCSSHSNIQVKMNPPLNASTQDVRICIELPNDSVNLQGSISGGTPPYIFKWIGIGNGNNLRVLPPLIDTVYSLEITDSVGCSVLDSVLVDRYIPHYPFAQADTTGCFLAALNLKPLNKASVGTYQWLGMGAGDSIRYYPPLGIQTQVLRYTDSLSCLTYDSVLIANYARPIFSLPQDTIVCAGLNLQIDASIQQGIAPFIYRWTPYLTANDSFVQDIFNQSSRVYLEVTDSTGCSQIDSIDVLVNTIPHIAAQSPLSVCSADSLVSLSALSGSLAGTWKGNGVSFISGSGYWWDNRSLGVGTYTLTFDAQNNLGACTASEDLVVELYPSPTVDAGPDTGLCGGGLIVLEAQVSGGVGNYAYCWNGDTSSKTAQFSSTILTDSMHRIQLVDVNGCQAHDSVYTFFYPIPEAVLNKPSSDTALCEDNALFIEADTLLNGAGHSYSFEPKVANGTSFIPDSSFTLLYKVVSVYGCIDSASRRITRYQNPQVLSIDNGAFCEDLGMVALDTFSSPATGIWVGRGVTFDSASSAFFFEANSFTKGTNTLRYMLIDSITGCFDSDSSLFEVEEKTQIDFSADSTVGNGTLNVQFSDLSTAGLKLRYVWSFGDGDTSNLQNPNHFYSSIGQFNVSLQVRGNQCVSERLKLRFIQVDSLQNPGIGFNGIAADETYAYPNPSKGIFVVSGIPLNGVYQVYDGRGQRVNFEMKRINDHQIELDLMQHPPAVYLLQIISDKESVLLRLLLE